jgi:nifR3 family TIM-barrel protein
MVEIDPSEKPVAVQLFGHSVEDVVEAAQLMEKRFDIIDVNCGCPAWKVIKTGAGSEMLKQPDKIYDFISRLVNAVKKPVTVKIRIGIDEHTINAVEVAQLVEEAGAAAIAVHGRTQQQGYRGAADWKVIKDVKDSVNIPVIGNGDVFTPEVFAQRLKESGVDAIMIARGALGNPYIFQQITDYMKKGSYEQKNGLEQFMELLPFARRHNLSFSLLKQHALQFSKGVVHSARLRLQLTSCQTADELIKLMKQASFLNEQKRVSPLINI